LPPSRPSLARLTLTGSAWTVIGYGGSQVLRLAGNVVISRMLFPEAFGLMALVIAFVIGLEMFSDLGIGTSIIRSRDGDRQDFLDTAWTLQVCRGLMLWVVACAIAWPAGWFYGEPALYTLLPVMGLTAVMAGLNSTSLHTLNRRMAFRTITLIELASQVVAIVAMIAFAWFRPSVWALAVGMLAAGFLRLVVSHALLPGHRNRFRWDRSAAAELFQFGKWILLSTFLTFAVGQSDRLIFGKLGELAWLGLYSIAVALAALPSVVILKIGSSVTFPAYSRVHEQGGDLPSAFRRSRLPLLMAGGLMVTCLAVAGPAAVSLLYDHRYHDAGFVLQLLAIGVWFQILECTNGALLLAQGEARLVAFGNAAKLVVMLVGIPVGYRAGDVYGAILGIAAADAARYAVSALAVRRRGMGCIGMDMLLTALVAAATVASLFVLRYLPTHLPADRFTRFALSTLPPLLIFAAPAGALLWENKTVRDRLTRKFRPTAA
jgi:O-antigen/teichoic acid export membrane protein